MLFEPVISPLTVRARGLHVAVPQVLRHVLQLKPGSYQTCARSVPQRVQTQIGDIGLLAQGPQSHSRGLRGPADHRLLWSFWAKQMKVGYQ